MTRPYRRLPLYLALAAGLATASCSRSYYPLGAATRKAYRDNLKQLRQGYDRFTPVILNPDSLQIHQWTAPSPNFDIRTPELVIIHRTEQNSCPQSLHTLTNPGTNRRVSAHYLICKDGTLYRLVDEHYRAWQAGVSRWGSFTNINSLSLGIELDNRGDEPFSGPQINTLMLLLGSIKTRYRIPQGNFIGHADVAPTRRRDPGIFFPWSKLAEKGFGYWRDSVIPPVPQDFDDLTALRLIGYDTRDTSAAIVAFKRHFIQTDTSAVLSEKDRQVLYDIFKKYNR